MRSVLVGLGLLLLPMACADGESVDAGDSAVVSDDEIQITLLGTNDIHGGLEPRVSTKNVSAGGMAFWAGAVDAMRRGLKKKLGDRSRVVLVDAGDQAQGTLLSNFNEGELIFRVMDRMGYDAIIT